MPSAARTADCAPSAATTRRASIASPPSVSRRIESAPAASVATRAWRRRIRGNAPSRAAQRPAEQAVLDGIAERCDALLLGRQDRGAEGAALGHVDAPDRRRPARRPTPRRRSPRVRAGCRPRAPSCARRSSAARPHRARPARSRRRRAAGPRARRRARGPTMPPPAMATSQRSGFGTLTPRPSGARSRRDRSACRRSGLPACRR